MITCTRTKDNREIRYGALQAGDTFLFHNTPCMITYRTGHSFPIQIETGLYMEGINNESYVIPIDCKLTYTVR